MVSTDFCGQEYGPESPYEGRFWAVVHSDPWGPMCADTASLTSGGEGAGLPPVAEQTERPSSLKLVICNSPSVSASRRGLKWWFVFWEYSEQPWLHKSAKGHLFWKTKKTLEFCKSWKWSEKRTIKAAISVLGEHGRSAWICAPLHSRLTQKAWEHVILDYQPHNEIIFNELNWFRNI